MPLFIYEARSGKLITSILRLGKRPTCKEVRLISIRGDSHFATPKLYAWCERRTVHLILGLSSNTILKRRAHPLLAAARSRYKHTGEPSRAYPQIRNQTKSLHRELWVIVMAEVSALGDNVRVIVTSF